jgi:hypothetical protein
VVGDREEYIDMKARLQELGGFKTRGKTEAAGGGLKAGESCKPAPPGPSVFIKAFMTEKMAAAINKKKIATGASMMKTPGVCAAPMA